MIWVPMVFLACFFGVIGVTIWVLWDHIKEEFK